MRLNTLHMVNFRQHVDTRIEFDSGLTGIIGPNGAGKSTVLEAIAWALYGTPAARGTRESIRSLRAGPRASVRVELDFDLGGHRYRVTRGLTNAELYLDGAASPIANSITGVTELLRRRLGMSLDEFFNTYFTGQKELSVMAAMGPSERAQFLSRVLGYERLRAAQALVRDRRKVISAEAAGLRAGMADPDAVSRALVESAQRQALAQAQLAQASARRGRAKTALDAVVPQWTAAQAARDQLQEILAELRVAESEEASAVRELERVDRELAELATARDELASLAAQVAPLAALREELARLEQLARAEGRRAALAESERSLAEELERLRQRRARLEQAPQLEEQAQVDLEARRAALREAEAQLQEKRTEWVRDRQEAETKRQALRQQYAEVKAQRDRLAQLGEESTCPTCARPLGDHVRTVLEQLDDQLEVLRVDGNYYRNRIEQLEATPEELAALEEQRRLAFEESSRLERRLAKCQAATHELSQVTTELESKAQWHAQVAAELGTIPAGYDGARHRALEAEAARLRPIEARVSRVSAQVEREPQLRTQHDVATGAAGQVRARLAALHARRGAIDFAEDRFASVRAAHEGAMVELRSAELTAVAADGEFAAARQALERAEQAQRELALAQARLDALNADRRLHDELDRAFSDLRTDLNVQLRPEISEVASGFLTDLTDGRYTELELDDQYNVLVLEDGIPKPVISGGEEDLANLVLRLAISQMIAERANHSFSLLILDEVFGALDEARRHNVVDLLRRLHDRFEQVILITHIESVREGLDRVVTVRYDGETGAAVVVQEGVASALDDEGSLLAGALAMADQPPGGARDAATTAGGDAGSEG